VLTETPGFSKLEGLSVASARDSCPQINGHCLTWSLRGSGSGHPSPRETSGPSARSETWDWDWEPDDVHGGRPQRVAVGGVTAVDGGDAVGAGTTRSKGAARLV